MRAERVERVEMARVNGALERARVLGKLTVEERVLEALRALWSMSADGDAKEVVADLAKEYKARMGRRVVSDELMTAVGRAQGVVRGMKRGWRGGPEVERIEKYLDEAAGEMVG